MTDSKAVKEERARMRAIITAPEAQGRTAQAHHLAFETDLAPAIAIGILAAAPMTPDAVPANATTGKRNSDDAATIEALHAEIEVLKANGADSVLADGSGVLEDASVFNGERADAQRDSDSASASEVTA